MISKTFNIFCDESTHLPHDGHPYMLYGYVIIASNDIKQAKEQIKAIKAKYNYNKELKWTNVHEKTYLMYKELIEYFFMVQSLNFRAVIVDKSQIDENRKDYTFDDFYFRMYFQLLHNEMNMQNTYNVYFDIKDTCSQNRLRRLRDILKWNSSIKNFQFIHSHESAFVQLADVLIGAINYNLRIEKKEINGKVIAKRKLIEYIKNQTNTSLNFTSPLREKKFNLFFINLK